MRFREPLVAATLVKRYKRFLADVTLDDGTSLTAHCPNTGSLLGCHAPGARVWLSRSDNPKRKYAYTWELVEVPGAGLVGINTGRSNALVREAIESGVIDELTGYDAIRPEVRYGEEGSRADFLLSKGASACYLEVKNVTAAVEDGIALFPDAISTRGTRHLRELMGSLRVADRRAVLCFCVQRSDVSEVRPADRIDPRYGDTLREALAAGVEAIAYRATLSPQGVALAERIPVVCP
ncbi:MAG: DNA/RNA nuclease SfsA [Gammaproteobacteria bacterium]|nr:DNA/RNA nuclease SfsA [Gammaproteobacteria bacterium]NIM73833.1 DNA/RNA nuclease SfsA [Gammaproteobacteria bacterium]NIN39410.1 DNA/RNA nuclease SfsA [Gammaproteobacteria bacterium]NIO25075.1 DNA/RNA nuclease SfsA [Gammaproteobacteria bacterium]NIO65707.1 DNA/RNA nuclease SfsA [Gammaproteobacteria bacterium]